MLANRDKKHDLISHCHAVARVAKAMAEYLGLPKRLIDDVFWAGLFHDLGKAVPKYQAFVNSKETDEAVFDSKYPRHHEISWAYVASKISNERILNAIYWHHARPLNDDFNYFQDKAEVLGYIENDFQAIKYLQTIWDILSQNFPQSQPFEPYKKVPDLFYPDRPTGTKNYNAELIAVRACVISADRYVSAELDACAVEALASFNFDPKEFLTRITAAKITGSASCPGGYDPARYKIQLQCAEAAVKNRTTIVKAPAGQGKTLIGILWSLQRGGKAVWVCPRNVVADAVYKNIIREIKALGLDCRIELYRTGKRQACNFTPNLDDDEFSADIIVTNIDNILSPMVANRVGGRLFLTLCANVILDEFHEFVSDSPMYAAFITYMRARHRLASNCHTLLLSATPMDLQVMWDTTQDQTVVLPDKDSHYPPAHDGTYGVQFVDDMPSAVKSGTLTICNSISYAQQQFKRGIYNLLIHHSFTDNDRARIEKEIYDLFGKGGNGVESNKSLAAALVVQAAMDISLLELYDSVCSPESTLQRIGRIDRWGNLQSLGPTIHFVITDLNINRSEAGAVSVVYDRNLRGDWIEFLRGKLNSKNSVTLAELYEIYNAFYLAKRLEIQNYLLSCYDIGLHGIKGKPELGLLGFYPVSLPEREGTESGKNLRNPSGSYNFSVKEYNTNSWLGPNDSMSESSELYQRYINNGALTAFLCNSYKMRRCMKGMATAGFSEYKRWVKKNRIPDNLIKWFRLARRKDTPLPDISREYDHQLGLIDLRIGKNQNHK